VTPSLRRIVVMPLVTLAAAGAIWLWASQETRRRNESVTRWAGELLHDVTADGEVESIEADPMIARQLVPALEELAAPGTSPAGTGSAGALEFVVMPGDTGAAGPNPPQPATHTVVFRRGGRDLLGLRLVNDGQNPITVVGFWRP
jgi:hypothetical protein